MNDKNIVLMCLTYFQLSSSVHLKQNIEIHNIGVLKIQLNLKAIEIGQNLENVYRDNRNIGFLEILVDQQKIWRKQCMIEIMRRFQFPEFLQNNQENERCLLRNDRHFNLRCMMFLEGYQQKIDKMMNKKSRLWDKNI
ncbi:unnamed protein product [Paramecium octaurelia]|uniref:Uncharacterized protein n=1 Tax=Paramecium octaurelia TaxID=43137 RepID=A0A8S1UHS0_PAROT|nr:unnamed protein product [Paramecium octaurelia]